MVNVAKGTLTVPVVSIGETNTANGALNITGGTTLISTSLTAQSNSLASASISVTGGALHVTNAIRETFPLATTMGHEIGRLREWAKTRTRPASAPPAARVEGG